MAVLRFIISLLYTIAGISAFVAFIWLKNYAAAILSIVTGVTNALLSFLHYLNIKRQLQNWYSSENIRDMGYFGFYMFTIGIMCLVYFSVIEIILKTPILPISGSIIIPIIWAFITLKSGLILYFYGRRYSRLDEDSLFGEEVEESA